MAYTTAFRGSSAALMLTYRVHKGRGEASKVEAVHPERLQSIGGAPKFPQR